MPGTATNNPISVVISADERYVADLERDGLLVRRDRLVGNQIVLAVPTDSEVVGILLIVAAILLILLAG